MTDPRKEKRHFRKMGAADPVIGAYYLGQAAAEAHLVWMPPRLQRNPYPRGRRRNAWEEGFRVQTDYPQLFTKVERF